MKLSAITSRRYLLDTVPIPGDYDFQEYFKVMTQCSLSLGGLKHIKYTDANCAALNVAARRIQAYRRKQIMEGLSKCKTR